MVLYIGNMLSKRGKTASVIESLSPRLREFIPVVSYSSKRSQWVRLIDMMWAIFKRRRVVSLVLIDSYSSVAFWYTIGAAALCRLFGIPFIPILHGGNFPARLIQSPKASNFVFTHSAINISPSLYLQEHFIKANFKVLYIPNFLRIENYPFKERNHFAPRLLWVRSFHQLYNPKLAVDVLVLLKKKYPSATLCMVGPDKDGSLETVREKAKSMKVDDAVTFTGLLQKSDWIKLSSDYDVFINTTNFDNMPVSVIEAMALGLPIVTTNVGGLPYLIKDKVDGLLIPPDSPIHFFSAIESILGDSALGRAMALAGRQKASGFDWNKVGHQWQDVINRYKLNR